MRERAIWRSYDVGKVAADGGEELEMSAKRPDMRPAV